MCLVCPVLLGSSFRPDISHCNCRHLRRHSLSPVRVWPALTLAVNTDLPAVL